MPFLRLPASLHFRKRHPQQLPRRITIFVENLFLQRNNTLPISINQFRLHQVFLPFLRKKRALHFT